MKSAKENASGYVSHAMTFVAGVRGMEPTSMSTTQWIMMRLISVFHPRKGRGIEELRRRNLDEVRRLLAITQSLLEEHDGKIQAQ